MHTHECTDVTVSDMAYMYTSHTFNKVFIPVTVVDL